MSFINNKYKIITKIGSGTFGSIYKGQNIRTNEYVAIKIEPIKNDLKLLKNESIIYQYLNGCHNIPSVKWFGKDNNNYYMVIDLLGPSLQDLIETKNKLCLKITLKIGIKIISIIKIIHDKGLVHRDIKPENFLFSLDNLNKLYLIDFGLCKKIIFENKHNQIKKTSGIIGSKNYMSINSHNHIELSRRDDLESLGYMLIYFYLGTLSWEDISYLSKNENINEKIKSIKQNILESNSFPEVLLI